MKNQFYSLILIITLHPINSFCGNNFKNYQGYTLIKFNTATGDYDRNKLNQREFQKYFKLWKTARNQNMILNPPDNASGKSCGTYKYLYSSSILTSRYLSPYIVFLINPGDRPCDYNENCSRNYDEETTICAHTQFLINFPVLIDTNNSTPADFYPDEKHFNTIMFTVKNTILNRHDAMDIIHLFFALNDVHEVTIRDIDTHTSPNDTTWIFKIVSVKESNSINSEFNHAKMTVNRNATIAITLQKVSDANKKTK